MRQPDPSEIFDEQHAAQYDERFARLAALRETLNLLTGAAFTDLPVHARILCVGAGTGSEILFLAERFPHWRFTAVEPSAAMLEVCRRRTAEKGLVDRCEYHHGYLDSLPPSEPFDAAAAILVSHFILSPQARAGFFREIANRLLPGGALVNADLSFDTRSPAYPRMLAVWVRLMQAAEVSAQQIEKLRAAYENDVSIIPPAELEQLIAANGFSAPLQIFQAGLIHGWYSLRTL